MKNSDKHGLNTSPVEVTNISSHGIWLLIHGKEYFLSYENFPWFKNGVVKQIINVKEVSSNHFYWLDLDVDLNFESIQYPEKFPLKASVV